MKRKIIVLLPILLFIPIFLWAAGGQDIAATTKLKGVIKDGVQIVAGLIALIAVIKIGLSTATKSIMSGQELSQKETKDVITKLGYLIIGLSVMLFASSIADFITQKRYRCRLCVYPPVFKLPLGIFLLVLAVLVTSVLGAAASSMWRLFIIIDILFVIVIYTINTFFAGNFGWSKKRPRHAHVKTGQYIARVNYALKLRQDGQQQDR
jgi:uncharacterized membrane protein YidH (DUF202 family)